MPELLNKRSKELCVGLLLFFTCLGAYPQTDKLSDIRERFDKFRRTNLQEKVFVHTDKSFYLAGEIMWFKIYSVDGAFHKPLDLNRVCYLEIVDANQKAVLQAKVELKNGAGNGSFFLPVSLSSGNYAIRAYTSWMKNSDAGYFFRKQIAIVNSLAASDVSDGEVMKDYDIAFFPEGGNLVSDIKSKVAFRAIDEDGRGTAFEGYIVDQNKDTVCRFNPLRFGIGSFSFTPRSGTVYNAVIKLPDNKVLVKELPAVYPAGYVMNVTENRDRQLEVSVQAANVPADREVYLFIHARQQILVAEKKVLNNGQAKFSISKDVLGEGISHLTVFNSVGAPVSERLYFSRPEPRVVLEASADQAVYATRKKVTIDLSALDKQGRGWEADLSVSVYDGNVPAGPNQNDIFSYLWLNSDLKGTVESPEYYVLNNSAEANEALDNLMLTHGWRRFRWEDVLGDHPISLRHLPEYQGHIISGRVIDKQTGTGVEDIVTYLSVPGRRIQLYPSKSGPGGQVRYFTRDFYGTNEIIVQTNMQDSLYRIEIDSPFSESISGSETPVFKPRNIPSDWFLTQSVNMQVQNIYSGSRMKSFYRPEIDSSAFYEVPDKKYMLDHFTRFKTMEEVLREYVAEVFVTRNRNNFSLSVPVTSYGSFQLNEPFVLLDGVPAFDRGNKIMGFDPAKVEKIEVVNKNYFLGPGAFNGVVNFTTYKGDLAGFEISSNANVLNYEGLQVKREFYSPKYETMQASSSRLPDFRSVLYWSPAIKTDKHGKTAVSFYTSDQKGKYSVSVNGISSDGHALSKTIQFEVK